MLRRNDERRYLTQVKNKIWRTFDPMAKSMQAQGGFANLMRLDEVRIPPAGKLSPLAPEGDAFTYVYRGGISQQQSNGPLVVQAGDFQRMALGDPRPERNVSSTEWAHIFRLQIACVPPQAGGAREASQQERFTAGQRRNTLCLVASPDGTSGSLVLASDALIYSTLLEEGHHFVHALPPKRKVWLHMVDGRATLDRSVALTRGDGIGMCGAPSVSLTAHEDSELLVVVMGPGTS